MSIVIIAIFALIATWALLTGQDVKELDFRKFVVKFAPKQQPHTSPATPLSTQTKNNRTSSINQHSEGNQSPNVNVGPGGTANFNYGAPKSGRNEE
jgi:hypothetical protein